MMVHAALHVTLSFIKNDLINFPTMTVLQPHMILMKEMTHKYFKWILDDGINYRSYSTPITPEGNYEYGCCNDKTTLE